MMKRLSKLTALLLAIALVLCAFAGVWAEGTEKKEAISKEEYEAALAAAMANFPNLTPEEQYKFLLSLNGDDELIDSYLVLLSEEQMSALNAYIIETEGYEIPETVVFTDAGPFLPAVNVGTSNSRLMRAASYALPRGNSAEGETDNGLELTKNATVNADGTYTIRMEAYTTGKVTTTTSTIPVDIVLVLDQSGSMAFDFSGNSTSTITASRQYAMKQAVNNFIESVAGKYSAEADHRMAIVTFGKGASTLQGWTYVDDSGKTTLQGKISGLDRPSDATNVAAGMKQAETLMVGSGYSYNGANKERQKVVIVFTDGVPTTDSEFDIGVANGAINSAKNLKDKGVTVYTVGIFNGANPYELYGATGFDTNSDGTPNSKWIKDAWGLFPGTDFPEADRPAGNRFLNYLSSNFPEADSIGLTRVTDGWGILHYKISYTIVKNFTQSANNYYLTASDSESLKQIFKTISDNIQTANIDLGANTVIKDIVTPYFNMPTNTSAIKLYTAKYNGTSFESREPATGVTAEIYNATRTVSVTGFDFNANFVSDTEKKDGTYGTKLIIEFEVTPKTDFLGGNGVPTNGDDSGVYANADATVAVEKFVVPKVDVEVKQIKPDVVDQNIYLTNEANLKALLTGFDSRINGTNNDFVDITYTIKNGETEIATYTIPAGSDIDDSISWDVKYGQSVSPALTADTTYTISCTVSPTNEGTAVATNGESTAKVNVFKPEITFQDSVVDYFSTYAFPGYYETNNIVSTIWKHKKIVDGTEVVEIAGTGEGKTPVSGDEPTLVCTYSVSSDAISMNGETGTIKATEDIEVNVTVTVSKPNSNPLEITGHTTFVHANCELTLDPPCTWNPDWTTHNGKATKTDSQDSDSIPEFLIHVKNIVADLTITKTGLDKYAYNDVNDNNEKIDRECAIIIVKAIGKNGEEETYRLALSNGQSVTIKDLKVGTDYTITEENGWTWRYSDQSTIPGKIVANPDNETNKNNVSITNDANNPYWLGGDNYKVNKFGTNNAADSGNGNVDNGDATSDADNQ